MHGVVTLPSSGAMSGDVARVELWGAVVASADTVGVLRTLRVSVAPVHHSAFACAIIIGAFLFVSD